MQETRAKKTDNNSSQTERTLKILKATGIEVWNQVDSGRLVFKNFGSIVLISLSKPLHMSLCLPKWVCS